LLRKETISADFVGASGLTRLWGNYVGVEHPPNFCLRFVTGSIKTLWYCALTKFYCPHQNHFLASNALNVVWRPDSAQTRWRAY